MWKGSWTWDYWETNPARIQFLLAVTHYRTTRVCILLALVVQRLNNAIHRINRYPRDSIVCFATIHCTVILSTFWTTGAQCRKRAWLPGGVLRCILSDGDVRSPVFGFEICDLRTLGLKFCSDFFWARDFGKDFFGGRQKEKPRVLVFKSNNCIVFFYQRKVDAKTVWNSLELLLFFFNWTFLGLRSGLLDFFLARVSPEGLFLGLTISPHLHIPVNNIPEYPHWGLTATLYITVMKQTIKDSLKGYLFYYKPHSNCIVSSLHRFWYCLHCSIKEQHNQYHHKGTCINKSHFECTLFTVLLTSFIR